MKGDVVKVVRGRKVPIGTVGTVIWAGEGRWGTRLGVKDATGEVHWTAASNVELVEAREAVAANAAFFAPPAWAAKGATVTLATAVTNKEGDTLPAGSECKVFWTGEDRREPGKARVGVRSARYRGYGRAPGFFVAEAELVEGTPVAAPATAAPVAFIWANSSEKEVA